MFRYMEERHCAYWENKERKRITKKMMEAWMQCPDDFWSEETQTVGYQQMLKHRPWMGDVIGTVSDTHPHTQQHACGLIHVQTQQQ
jgi:hypothetical protein